MKRFITFGLMSVLLFSACTGIDNLSDEDFNSTVFELVKEGVRADGEFHDVFEGTEVVSGAYYYNPESMPYPLTFRLDEDSKDLVPRKNGWTGEIFTFSNYDETLLELGLNDNSEDCREYTGTATIEIDGYSSSFIDGNILDITELKSVVENSGPVAACNAELITELEDLQQDWSMALFRGDAELAPSYSEFLEDMRGISENLNTITDQYEVSDELEELSRQLHSSLMRGDAELAPSYEEAMESAIDMRGEFDEILEGMLTY
jgi:hypothetical protein